ncbi:MAG: tetratricopeptide repeat protein [Thermomicrobiales bacterium]
MVEPRFGDVLRRFRLAAGLSQEELAARSGLSVQAIGTLERGERRAPRRETIESLSAALGLDADGRAELDAAGQVRRRLRPVEPVVPPPVVAVESGLIGRGPALAELLALVRHAGTRLLTMTGPGGVGKTRLATAVAGVLEADFADGMRFVSLAELRDPGQIAAQIGGALGLSGREIDPVASIRDYLRDRATLLVLDNFEHLLAAAPLVTELLANCPRLVVVATSRAPLRLPHERVYDLPPLDCPEPGSTVVPSAVAEFGATALFAARAREVRPDFAVTELNAPIIAAICARLDGLPLAIELAVARLNVLTPAELLARLTERLPLLTRGSRELPDRQRTLRATLAWGHELLDLDQQLLFRRLAVFVGGATRDAIEAVCALAFHRAEYLHVLLDTLVEQRLVRQEFAAAEAPARYNMLETVREYAAEQLANSGEEAILRQRHAAHFRELAAKADAQLNGPEQGLWIARLAADHDNLRAALRWSINADDGVVANRLGSALWRFWYRAGYWTEGREWLGAIEALPMPTDTLVAERSRVQRGVGVLAVMQSDFATAEVHLQAALELARQAGEVADAAAVLDNLAVLAKERGDFRAALDLHTEALAANRELGESRAVAATLNNLGGDHDSLSNYREAVACFTEALTLSRLAGDGHTELISMVNLGAATQHLGNYAQARALGEEALARARQLDNARYAAIALTNLGAVALDRGEARAAVAYFREALDFVRNLGSGTRLALAHGNLSEALRLTGDLVGASAALAEGVARASAIADAWSATHLELYQGALAEDLGDRPTALERYRAALAHARQIEYGWGIVSSLTRLGALTPDSAESAACFRESAARCATMATPRLGASALEGMAAVFVANGDADRAARLLGAAESIRVRLGTPREPAWAAHCARTAAAACDALGDAAFDEAQRAGRGLDLFEACALSGVSAE